MPAGMAMPMPMKPGAMPGMMGGDGMMAMMMSKPLPERLAHHEMMMKAHLKALHKVRSAVSGLYRVLTPRAAGDGRQEPLRRHGALGHHRSLNESDLP